VEITERHSFVSAFQIFRNPSFAVEKIIFVGFPCRIIVVYSIWVIAFA
jgi:hypothetical protein